MTLLYTIIYFPALQVEKKDFFLPMLDVLVIFGVWKVSNFHNFTIVCGTYKI